MNEELEFEASIKSRITPDVAYIRQYDEILSGLIKENSKNNPLYFLCFFLAAVIFFFVNKIVMVICALLGGAALFLYIRTKDYVKKLKDEEYWKEIYEEGLLCPGMIIKTNPLTIMTIADMRTDEYCENQFACYVMQVEHLPGAKGELYEKIPCSCMFYYEKGDYHSSFEPHPLYWATKNQEEIREAIRQLDEDQNENAKNEWEVLKHLSDTFPDLKPGQIFKLDASYMPVGVKYDWDDKYMPVITEQLHRQYPKIEPDVSYVNDDIPAAFVYNQMIDLAMQHQVYEYISTHCKGRDYDPLSNPGYFTYMSDPLTFLEALDDRNITLAEGEYPLIAGIMLLTTKGCWKKKKFIPWQEITLDAGISSLGGIETTVNGTCIVEFKPNTKYYQNNDTFTKEDMVIIKQMESERIHHFLQGLKELFDKH